MFSGANSLLVSGSVVGGGNFKYFFGKFSCRESLGKMDVQCEGVEALEIW